MKEDVHWPLGLLLARLAVGILLTLYRTKQLPADKLLVEIASTQEAAAQLGFNSTAPRYLEFTNLLQRAMASVSLGDLEDARTLLDNAKAILIADVDSAADSAIYSIAETARGGVSIKGAAARSKFWLGVYYFFTYGIALSLLAAAGMNELYFDDPTFGDDGWADYLAVIAWGFGSQATSRAVGQLVSSWNLPGLNRPPASA